MAIVVGYVAKPEGRAALRRAAEEAQLRGVRLIVLASFRGRDSDADAIASYEAELVAVAEALTKADIDYQLRQPVRGMDAAEDLIAAAVEVQADMIVIGLRRRSPVGKLILGSNAQRVLLDAPCPVLAVKSAPADEPGER